MSVNSRRRFVVFDRRAKRTTKNCTKCLYTVSQKTSHCWLAIALTHVNRDVFRTFLLRAASFG